MFSFSSLIWKFFSSLPCSTLSSSSFWCKHKSSHRRCSIEKAVLKTFALSTKKHLQENAFPFLCFDFISNTVCIICMRLIITLLIIMILKKPVLESLYNKAAWLRTCNFIKKRLQHRGLPVNFVEFLITPCLQNSSGRLLLDVVLLGFFLPKPNQIRISCRQLLITTVFKAFYFT